MSDDLKELWVRLGSPKHVLAPMVEASELAWRVLGRRYGVQLTYSPMIHAELLLRDKSYRQSSLQFAPEDRPLIIQFCANKPEVFVEAAAIVQPYCDAVDLNLGCPQGIARRGHYGAFLQDEWDLISQIVRAAAEKLTVPVTCKIRVFPEVEKTIAYAKMLEAAGASLLTVHGRTREMKGQLTGLADWEQIKLVKSALRIPVIANGNIQYFDDVQRCLKETGADAVMSAEGHLHNPALFAGIQPSIYAMSLEYLDCATLYPCPMSVVRGHLFKLCHHALQEHPEFRSSIGVARTIEQFREAIKKLEAVCSKCETNQKTTTPHPHWICQPYERPTPKETTPHTVHNNHSPNKRALQEERLARRSAKWKAKRAKQEEVLSPSCQDGQVPQEDHSSTKIRAVCCPVSEVTASD